MGISPSDSMPDYFHRAASSKTCFTILSLSSERLCHFIQIINTILLIIYVNCDLELAIKSFESKSIHVGRARSLREGILLLCVALTLYLLVSLVSYHAGDPGWSRTGLGEPVRNLGGRVGAWFSDLCFSLLGYLAYLIPLMVSYSGYLVFRDRFRGNGLNPAELALRWIGFGMAVTAGCGLAALYLHGGYLPLGAGGMLGNLVGDGLAKVTGSVGATLIFLGFLFAGITLSTGLSWISLVDLTVKITFFMVSWLRNTLKEWRFHSQSRQTQTIPVILVAPAKKYSKMDSYSRPEPKIIAPPVPEPQSRLPSQFRPDARSLNSIFPSLALLDPPREIDAGFSPESLAAISHLVEVKLADFGIEVKVEAVHPGPVITRFELLPAPGIKVNRITNLAKDLARALSVISVRIVEVIPGKPVIGLEIPNENREMVSLSEILHAAVYENSKSPLTLALGKDIAGIPIVADLGRMPHLLVAGTTGAGKSVAVNAMLLSLLYKAGSHEVRLILIDPKMLELSVYEGIPHLLTPVVTDMKDAANALRWCVAEMERRYQLMSKLGVRNLAGYNHKVRESLEKETPIPDPLFDPKTQVADFPPPLLEPMPFIVVVVDEFADMIMVVGKKVEELIARLAQKARAAGIHLILATQRPSVDVITGLIKANIPSRIAFQVSSRIDSRTILDQQGAEQLLGAGDMLYLPPGRAVPERIHGAFVSDQEVHRVVEAIKQQGKPNYLDEIVNESLSGAGVPGLDGGSDRETDTLYDQAVAIVTESRKASISYVQRRLKIGYNRAARMIEDMEVAGIVSMVQTNGNREVLAPPPPQD